MTLFRQVLWTSDFDSLTALAISPNDFPWALIAIIISKSFESINRRRPCSFARLNPPLILGNDVLLKLSDGADDGKDSLAQWRSGVDVLLVRNELNPEMPEFIERGDDHQP
jgi:hypothetical protein